MTHARATPGADFKNYCMLSGFYDGSDRDHFFWGVSLSFKSERAPALHCGSVGTFRLSAYAFLPCSDFKDASRRAASTLSQLARVLLTDHVASFSLTRNS